MRPAQRQQRIRRQAQRIAQQQRRIRQQRQRIQGMRQNQQRPPVGPAPPPPPQQPPLTDPYDGDPYSEEDIGNAPYRSENSLRQEAALTRQKQERLASVNAQRQALGIGYGLGEFGGDYTNNPYSRAALLQRQYDRNQRSSLNSYAAAGQLYAGSLSNARNFNRFNYDVSYDSLRKQYDAALGRLGREELDAYADFDTGYEAALRQAVNDGMVDERPEPWEADPLPEQGGGGARGIRNPRRPVIRASRKRIKGARNRIKDLKIARGGINNNPARKKKINQRIRKQQVVVQRNRQRIQNIRQGKPTNQGIRPKKKGGRR